MLLIHVDIMHMFDSCGCCTCFAFVEQAIVFSMCGVDKSVVLIGVDSATVLLAHVESACV